jgi:hypothetical protein
LRKPITRRPEPPAASRCLGRCTRANEATMMPKNATAASTAPRQPRPRTANAPTDNGARREKALATTLDSVTATTRCSPWRSARMAGMRTSCKEPSRPINAHPDNVILKSGPKHRRRAPTAIPATPVHGAAQRPKTRATQSPIRPAAISPAANALKCRLTPA